MREQDPSAFGRAAANATQAATLARSSWTSDGAGRRNPFFRAETRGRVDAFVPFFPYAFHERLGVIDRQLDKAVAPIEARFRVLSSLSTASPSSSQSSSPHFLNIMPNEEPSTTTAAATTTQVQNARRQLPPLTVLWTTAATRFFAARYSASEGLRPVITALSDITEQLREARDRKVFDPAAPGGGCVVLLDYDPVANGEDFEDEWGEDEIDHHNCKEDGDGASLHDQKQHSSNGPRRQEVLSTLSVHSLRLDELQRDSRLLKELLHFYGLGLRVNGGSTGNDISAEGNVSSSGGDGIFSASPPLLARRVISGENIRHGSSRGSAFSQVSTTTMAPPFDHLTEANSLQHAGHVAPINFFQQLARQFAFAVALALATATVAVLVKALLVAPVLLAAKWTLYGFLVAAAVAAALYFNFLPKWLRELIGRVFFAFLRFICRYPRLAAGVVGFVWFGLPLLMAGLQRWRAVWRSVRRSQRGKKEIKKKRKRTHSEGTASSLSLSTTIRPLADAVLAAKLEDASLRRVVQCLLAAFADIHAAMVADIRCNGTTCGGGKVSAVAAKAKASEATLRRHCAHCPPVRSVTSKKQCKSPANLNGDGSSSSAKQQNRHLATLSPPLFSKSTALFDLCCDTSLVVDNKCAVGTIVGVWPASKRFESKPQEAVLENVVGSCGRQQATSLLCLYGPVTSVVLALDDGVYEFKHYLGRRPAVESSDGSESEDGREEDEERLVKEEGRGMGWWECTRARIRLPGPGDVVSGRILSPANLRASAALPGYAALIASYSRGDAMAVAEEAAELKTGDEMETRSGGWGGDAGMKVAKPAMLRYTGAIAPDVYQHFTRAYWEEPSAAKKEKITKFQPATIALPKACVFVNPACEKYPANRRLAFEAAPLAFLIERAGGASSDLSKPPIATSFAATAAATEGRDCCMVAARSILDVPIASMTQTTAMCLGATEEVDRCNRYLAN